MFTKLLFMMFLVSNSLKQVIKFYVRSLSFSIEINFLLALHLFPKYEITLYKVFSLYHKPCLRTLFIRTTTLKQECCQTDNEVYYSVKDVLIKNVLIRKSSMYITIALFLGVSLSGLGTITFFCVMLRMMHIISNHIQITFNWLVVVVLALSFLILLCPQTNI